MSASNRSPLRVDVVLGTRPEAVKLLPVLRALGADQRFRPRLIATAQHREMLDQILAPFGVRPDLDLDVMRPGQTLNELVGRVVPLVDRALAEDAPDFVLVQGDTTSAFCAALAAFQRGVRVGHVEAGLRSFDRFQPFPEESNRRMIGALADLHFAPTATSAANLAREGVDAESLFVTGNTAIDALLAVLQHEHAVLPDMRLRAQAPLVLITLHRRENWLSADAGGAASPLERVLAALGEVAARRPDVDFVYPVHRNPQVLRAAAGLAGRANVQLVDPLAHGPFVRLMERAHVIVSDSGGVQEEAPTLGVPVLVTRQATERPEGLGAGSNKLVGTDPDALRAALEAALAAAPPDPALRPCPSPFGDGRAAQRICAALLFASARGERPRDFEFQVAQTSLRVPVTVPHPRAAP